MSVVNAVILYNSLMVCISVEFFYIIGYLFLGDMLVAMKICIRDSVLYTFHWHGFITYLCLCVFVFFCFILHSCCIIVSTVRWT